MIDTIVKRVAGLLFYRHDGRPRESSGSFDDKDDDKTSTRIKAFFELDEDKDDTDE